MADGGYRFRNELVSFLRLLINILGHYIHLVDSYKFHCQFQFQLEFEFCVVLRPPSHRENIRCNV